MTHGHKNRFFHPDNQRERRYTNERRLCRIPDCSKHRYRLASLCSMHRTRKQRSGTTDLLRLTIEDLYLYRRRASKFLARNQGHPAVKAAWTWSSRFVEGRASMLGGQLVNEAKALEDAGVAAWTIVETTLAWHLFAHRNPERFGRSSSANALAVLGSHIARFGRKPARVKRVRKNIDQSLGDVIWSGLASFLINAATAEARTGAKERQLQEALAVEFPEAADGHDSNDANHTITKETNQ